MITAKSHEKENNLNARNINIIPVSYSSKDDVRAFAAPSYELAAASGRDVPVALACQRGATSDY